MINCLSHREILYEQYPEHSKGVCANETLDVHHVTGSPAHIFFDNPVNREHKKGQDDWVFHVAWGGVNTVSKEFEFTKFSAKKQQNPKQFLFHKKQAGKNFFLEKNC